MAIAIEHTGTAFGATTNVVVSRPAAAIVGRYLFCIFNTRENPATLSLPSGWTQLATQDRSFGQLIMAGKIMTNSEPSSYTFTQTGGDEGVTCILLVLSGIRNPLVAATGTTKNVGFSVTCPSVSATNDGVVIRAVNGVTTLSNPMDFSWTGATEHTEYSERISTIWNTISCTFNSYTGSSGSTGTATATQALSSGSTLGAITLVLAEAKNKASTRVWDCSAQDDANWTGWDPSRHGINAGRFEITPPGSTAAYYPLQSATTYDLTQSWFSAEIVQPLNQGNDDTETAIIARIDTNNQASVVKSGTTLIFREKVSGSNSDTTITYSNTTHRYWRIRESGGTLYWDTSPDGSTWTNLRNKSTSLNLTAIKLELTAGAYDTGTATPGSALFDNINMPSPQSFFAFF